MFIIKNRIALATIMVLSSWALRSDAAELPTAGTTETLAVKLHSWEYDPDIYQEIADAGFKIVQTELRWEEVEIEDGVFDFEVSTIPGRNYDALVRGCASKGLRVEFSLFTHNACDVDSSAWRQDFADYAVESLKHFNALDGGAYDGTVIYQIWQEPDGGGYWPSYAQPGETIQGANARHANEYMDLVEVAVPQMRTEDADCTIFGPELSTANYGGVQIDYFLGTCLSRGLVTAANDFHVDTITLHPYRDAYEDGRIPETNVKDYNNVRKMVDVYNEDMPIACTEWGYTSSPTGERFRAGSNELQANYLARCHLIHMSQDMPFAAWFKWIDSSSLYGVVEDVPSFSPKPSYYANQKLANSLQGKTFQEDIDDDAEDYQLLFTNGNGKTVAAWTTGVPHEETIFGRTVEISGTPQYVAATSYLNGTSASNWHDSYWSEDSTPDTEAWGEGNRARFNKTGGGAYTITINQSGGNYPLVNGLDFGDDGYTLSGGTITFAGDVDAGEIAIGYDRTATINSELAGIVGMEKDGLGTIVLTGSSTYSGTTTIEQGTLVVGSSGSLYNNGTSEGSIVINDGGTLRFDRDDAFGDDQSESSVVVTVNSGGTVASNGTFTTLKDLVLNGGTLLSDGGHSSSYGTYGLKGTITVGGSSASAISTGSGSYNIIALGNNEADGYTNFYVADATGDSDADLTVSTTLADSRSVGGAAQVSGLVKTGEGLMVLACTNNYTGGTTIDNGMLEFNSSATIPSTGIITINSGSALLADGPTGYTNASNWLSSGKINTSSEGALALNADTNGINLSGYSGLSIGANGNRTLSGTITPSGSTYRFGGGGGTLTVTGALSGARSLEVNGNVILSGTKTYTEGTTVNAGILEAMTTGSLPGYSTNGKVSVASGATLAVNTANWTQGDIDSLLGNTSFTTGNLGLDVSSESFSYSSAMSGSRGLKKLGPGVLLLTGSHTYTGDTTISAGTLALSGSGSFYTNGTTAGNIAVNDGGTLRFDRDDAFGDDQSEPSVVVTVNSGGTAASSDTFTVLNNLVLNGGTLLSDGGHNANYGTFGLKGTVSAGGSSVSTISTGTGSYNLIALGNNTSGGSTNFDVADATGDANADLTVSTVLTNSRNVGGTAQPSGLVKTGEGTMTLSVENVYTGTTAIDAGTLALSGSGSLYDNGTNAGSIDVNNGGTLRFDRDDAFGDDQSASSVEVTVNNGGTVASNGTFTVLNNLVLNGGMLLSNGGHNANYGTFGLKGTVTVGTSVGSTICSGAGSNNLIALGNNTSSGSTTFNVARGIGNPAVDLTVSTTLTNSRNIYGTSQASRLVKTGTGLMMLNGENTYTGGTTINNGTLLFSDDATIPATGQITIDSNTGSGTYGVLVADGPSGYTTAASWLSSGKINSSSDGTLALNHDTSGINVSSYSGLFIGANDSSTLSGTITPYGTTYRLGGGRGELTVSSTLSGSGYSLDVHGDVILTANNNYTGTTTINAGTLELSGSGSLYDEGTDAGSITINNGAKLMFSRNDAFGDALSASSVAITVNSGGAIKSNNTFTVLNNLTLSGASVLCNGGHSANFGSFGLKGTVSVGGSSASGITYFAGRNNQIALGNNTSSGYTTFDVSDATGDDNTDLTVMTVLTDSRDVYDVAQASGLVKNGAGIMSLVEENTYTGPTTINAGTLALVEVTSEETWKVMQGTINSSSGITLNSGGTLLQNNDITTLDRTITFNGGTFGGTGEYSGNLTVGNGHLVPGGGIGDIEDLLISGDLTLASNSYLDFDFGTTEGECDLIEVDGNLVLDGTLNIISDDLDGGDYTIFSGMTSTPTDNGLEFGVVPSGHSYSYVISHDSGSGTNSVVVTAAPEPETLLLLATAGLSLLGYIRNKRSRTK